MTNEMERLAVAVYEFTAGGNCTSVLTAGQDPDGDYTNLIYLKGVHHDLPALIIIERSIDYVGKSSMIPSTQWTLVP